MGKKGRLKTPSPAVNPFDIDVSLNGGYWYTTKAPASSVFANERLTRATLSHLDLHGKRVLDVGCGDGTYTYEIYNKGKPASIVGIDSSKQAIGLAKKRYASFANLKFFHKDVYGLSMERSFDVAIVRGVIHHVPDAPAAISAIGTNAHTMLILEPNGYNPILKIIEKISPYHRAHAERSYQPDKLRGWIKEAGFTPVAEEYVGLVPFFCPEGVAQILKKLEPMVESLPAISHISCAVYVVVAQKKN